MSCKGAKAEEKATQPPKEYTEGTLLKAMESAGRAMEDEELRETMKDSGLGTPATRAATIERLKQVGYMHTIGKKLEIAPKGCAAIELIRGAGVELLASPVMTGQWERRLSQIARDEASDDKFMEQVKQFARHIVEKVADSSPAPAGTFEEPERGSKGAKGARGGRTASGSSSSSGRSSKAGTGASSASKGSVAPATSAARASMAAAGSRASSPVRASLAAGALTAGSSKSRSPKAAALTGTNSAVLESASATEARPPGLKMLGVCPACGGSIIEGKRGYGCSRFREGCRFVIWKEQHGKLLTPTMLKALLTKGTTSLLSFSRPEGSVKGRLVLKDRNTGDTALEIS